MSKNQFISELNKELNLLNKEERNEIISFYEDRFQNATFEGKTEQDILNELESPKDIARNVLNEYGINSNAETRKHRIDLLSVFGLIWFDILVSSWLIPVAITVPLALAGSWFSYIGVFTVFKFLNFFPALVALVGMTAGYIIYLFIILIALEIGLKVTQKVVVWHITVFTGDTQRSLKNKIDSFSFVRLFKKLNIPKKIISITIVASLVVIFVTSIAAFYIEDFSFASIGSNNISTYDVETTVTDYEVSDMLELVTEFENMEITYITTSDDKLTLTHVYNYDNGYKVTHNQANNTLTISDSSHSSNWYENIFNWGFNFNAIDTVQKLTIAVPSSIELEKLSLSNVYGNTSVTNFKGEDLIIDTVSSNVELNDSIWNHSSIDVVSGDIYLANSNGESLSIDSISGNVNLENITSPDNSNLSIDLISGDITLSNVYMKNVHVDPISGNIDYFNDDTDYVLNSLEIDKISGSISKS